MLCVTLLVFLKADELADFLHRALTTPIFGRVCRSFHVDHLNILVHVFLMHFIVDEMQEAEVQHGEYHLRRFRQSARLY